MLAGTRPRVRRFAVVGHADADEVDAAALAERRARVVMRALVERGFAADRMEARGVGADPVKGAPAGTNRLVTFVTLQDYRGGVRHWRDGRFVECYDDRAAPECGTTAEYTPKCLER